MGVKGLWRLLLPIGRRISIETLEGKILAIDASIWLTQFLQALKDPNTGSTLPAAHLVGFLRRLCKLRFHGIRPVLVFDGATPEIKLRELKERRQRREQFASRGKGEDGGIVRMAKKLLTQQLQKHGRGFINKALEEVKAKEEEKKEAGNETGSQGATKQASTLVASKSSSLAPGFYDPNMEDEDKKEEIEIDDSNKPNDTADSEYAKQAQMLENDDRDILDILNDEEEAARRAREEELGEETNDWDRAVVTKLEKGQDDKQDKETDDSPPKWNYGRRTKKKGSASSYGAFKQPPNGKFDVDYVAALPSHERKDWVEEAQKNRRMQSRREFMKVAYDQEKFSQSQLQNFLKSTKLNQDIHKMATKAAKHESSELGVRQEGDRTKRIIFEQDIESKQQKQKKSKAALLAEFSKKKLSILEDNNNQDSDNDSDEIEWEDADAKPAASTTRQRAIVDDDDSDDEPKGSLHTDARHTAVPFFSSRTTDILGSNEKKAPPPTQDPVARRPQVPHDETDNDNVMDSDAKLAQQLQDEELERAMQESENEDNATDDGVLPAGVSGGDYYIPSDDDDDNDAQGGGGFLPSTDDGGGGGLSFTSVVARASTTTDSDCDDRDPKMAQQLADERLARALQNAEYEGNNDDGGGGFLPVGDNSGPLYPSDNDSQGGGGFLPSSENGEYGGGGFLQSSVAKAPAKASNYDDDSDNDNVDAKAKMAQQLEDEKLAMALQNEEYGGNDDDGERGDDGYIPEVVVLGVKPAPDKKHSPKMQKGDDGHLKPPPKSSIYPTMKESKSLLATSLHNENEDEEDDDIDWEDGGVEDSEQVEDTKMSPANTNHAIRESFGARITSSKSDSYASGRVTSKSDSYATSEDLIMDDFDDLPGSATTTNDWDLGTSKSEKVSEALTHAQDTASRLTDWAGRAFRRAVAEHAQESGTKVPEASKPSALVPKKQQQQPKDATSDDDDDSDADEEEENPVVVHSKTPEKKKSNPTKLPISSPYFDSADMTSSSSSPDYDDMVAFSSSSNNQTELDPSTVTDEMKAQVMQLLHLFGVPFVQAPAEAESQCACLEQLGLVDGIVTEDSDAFVFGGQYIYKNIFDDKKYVELYKAEDAAREMNLTRDGMVGLALLLGGDYTQGVHGVGIVNGMEIVQAFDVSDNVTASLQKFRTWLDGFDLQDAMGIKGEDVPLTKEQEFHKKHKSARNRWEAPKHFPDPRVLQAYLNPVVDKSAAPFTWGIPNEDGLMDFCARNIGWTAAETKRVLKPVLDRLQESDKMRQTRLDTFMRYEDGIKFADVRSKRLREVLESVQADSKEKEESKKKHKSK